MRSCGKTSVRLVNTGPRSPSQRPMTRSFDIFLFCAWTNGWAKNPDVGDLRRHRAHYDVTVMCKRLNFHAVISVSKSGWTLRPQCVPPAWLGSIPFFQFNSNSNSFKFNSNSNSNSFGMKNSNSNSNSFLSIPIPIPIPFYQFLFNSFLKPN